MFSSSDIGRVCSSERCEQPGSDIGKKNAVLRNYTSVKGMGLPLAWSLTSVTAQSTFDCSHLSYFWLNNSSVIGTENCTTFCTVQNCLKFSCTIYSSRAQPSQSSCCSTQLFASYLRRGEGGRVIYLVHIHPPSYSTSPVGKAARTCSLSHTSVYRAVEISLYCIRTHSKGRDHFIINCTTAE